MTTAPSTRPRSRGNRLSRSEDVYYVPPARPSAAQRKPYPPRPAPKSDWVHYDWWLPADLRAAFIAQRSASEETHLDTVLAVLNGSRTQLEVSGPKSSEASVDGCVRLTLPTTLRAEWETQAKEEHLALSAWLAREVFGVVYPGAVNFLPADAVKLRFRLYGTDKDAFLKAVDADPELRGSSLRDRVRELLSRGVALAAIAGLGTQDSELVIPVRGADDAPLVLECVLDGWELAGVDRLRERVPQLEPLSRNRAVREIVMLAVREALKPSADSSEPDNTMMQPVSIGNE